ncbi:electron transport complex subunit RsxG [Moritella marina ATCC 15381]|uniref:Ion-translocating oxidoreductase complex subunit G n=1 Tax=Moritella marina ATCC 15381 TaxID=1202962 RepID=A0A5J6WL21_MORMI|nr:electron transport complex subunit RsxG [Moritella marina]QFI38134.1 electron transport complex subunit RsxG [Moritella marina ATCC 15381]
MLVSMRKNGGILAIFALACTSVVAITNAVTKDRIAEQEQTQLLKIINQLLPEDSHDNNIFQSCKLMTNEALLGSSEPQRIFTATKNNKPIGYAIEGIAPKGYSGNIKLVVGINTVGKVTGVRILGHNETPGLGDKVEYRKSNWLDDFVDQTLTEENAHTWAVTKDGGDFDSFTGATITPRAVVGSVKNILTFYQSEQFSNLNNAPSCWSKS